MHNVILNLRNELIRSISAIDAWFDKDSALLNQRVTSTGTVAEFLYDLVAGSRHLLDAVTNSPRRNANGPLDLQFPHDRYPDQFITHGKTDLSAVRTELREQLDRCLIYLEMLLQRQVRANKDVAEEDVEKLGGYQGIYLLLIHLKRYTGELNQVADRYDRSAKRY